MCHLAQDSQVLCAPVFCYKQSTSELVRPPMLSSLSHPAPLALHPRYLTLYPQKNICAHTELSVVPHFIMDPPESQGMTTILIMVDSCSAGPQLISLPELSTAFCTAECYGIPKDTVSDQGPQFMSQVWAGFMEKLGVSLG